MRQSKIIGLTGGSGSGKSTVAAALRSVGALVVDCDKIAHENMAVGGIAYPEIAECFGSEILAPNGEIDRKRLGGIVFNDRAMLERLNAITHRHIIAVVKAAVASAKCELVVIDAPLLYQTGLDKLCDEVWVTDAPLDIRLDRIAERDGITREAAMARIKNQGEYPQGDRHIITDFETVEELESYVKELL
jgi:dephospho-CoA kinase